MITIGVLAVQGDFAEHAHALRLAGAFPREIRSPVQLDGLDGLILPGGESTTFSRLMRLYGLTPAIIAAANDGLPIWGTCAGLIALAQEITGGTAPILGLMDIAVDRNAYGRQVDSFQTDIAVPALGGGPFHAIFIRAPKIVRAGHGVEILAALPDGTPVAVRQGALLGTSFHPELTADTRFHRYFLTLAQERQTRRNAAAV